MDLALTERRTKATLWQDYADMCEQYFSSPLSTDRLAASTVLVMEILYSNHNKGIYGNSSWNLDDNKKSYVNPRRRDASLNAVHSFGVQAATLLSA